MLMVTIGAHEIGVLNAPKALLPGVRGADDVFVAIVARRRGT